jgi:hypothetical protein
MVPTTRNTATRLNPSGLDGFVPTACVMNGLLCEVGSERIGPDGTRVLYLSTPRSVNVGIHELERLLGDSLRIAVPKNQSIETKNTLVGEESGLLT